MLLWEIQSLNRNEFCVCAQNIVFVVVKIKVLAPQTRGIPPLCRPQKPNLSSRLLVHHECTGLGGFRRHALRVYVWFCVIFFFFIIFFVCVFTRSSLTVMCVR